MPALAADGIREEPVQFDAGSSGATLMGRLQGREDLEYVLGAKAGQRMTIALHLDNPQSNFNILSPGSDEAIFVGSTSSSHFEGEVPESGEYRIRVYLTRAAARRGESVNDRLDATIRGAAPEGESTGSPEFADGLAGDPDFWQVTGLPRATSGWVAGRYLRESSE